MHDFQRLGLDVVRQRLTFFFFIGDNQLELRAKCSEPSELSGMRLSALDDRSKKVVVDDRLGSMLACVHFSLYVGKRAVCSIEV